MKRDMSGGGSFFWGAPFLALAGNLINTQSLRDCHDESTANRLPQRAIEHGTRLGIEPAGVSRYALHVMSRRLAVCVAFGLAISVHRRRVLRHTRVSRHQRHSIQH